MSCVAPCAGGGGGKLAGHIELDFARQLDDGFGVMAVLEQCVFDGLGAVDEQAAIKAVLFLGDPVAAFVPADKDDSRCRATRWRFDELHVGIPSRGEGALPAPPLAISSRLDMNSRAARRRSHRSRIRSRTVSSR